MVEDDPANALLITAMLDRAGHQVITAVDGASAMNSARSHPDLVLLDVSLPGTMAGFDVCRPYAPSRTPRQRRSSCSPAGPSPAMLKPGDKRNPTATSRSPTPKTNYSVPSKPYSTGLPTRYHRVELIVFCYAPR